MSRRFLRELPQEMGRTTTIFLRYSEYEKESVRYAVGRAMKCSR